MAMRRPRIKPVANIQLNAKRKAKTANDVKTVKNSESESKEVKDVEKQDDFHSVEESTTPIIAQDSQTVETSKEVRKDSSDTPAIEDNLKSSKLDQQEENAEDETSYDNVAAVAEDNDNGEKLENEEPLNEKSSENIQNEAKIAETETVSDTNAFKCPPKVEFQRLDSHISNSGVDDVFYSDIEENAIQMETEKPSANGCPMSPSKNLNRQRIKATPHFGQRRNSFIGTSPSPHTTTIEDCNRSNSINNEFVQPSPTRRERHYSASFTGNNHSGALNHHHHHTTHKYLPSGIINNGVGRIRTESGCSVFSDTNNSTHKSSRKHEDNKQNLRKEFEARFFNGVPEKSVIKMSDLIYYNPVSNPMEQKSNPNVKQEQTESSTNEIKPFDGKKEKESETKDIENEGVPVPQLKLNAKGELILDDKSLVIETTAEQEARKVLANSSLIYLDENTGMNGFYSRQKRTREWLPAETIKFYRCLQNVGTDFSLMVSLFPNRTRRDLKLKFKKEERKNGHLINKALLYPKQFNLEALKQQIDDEEKLREEQAKNTKEAKKRSKKRKLSTSAADRVLQSADAVYQNENVQKQKRVRKTVASEKNENRTATSAIETDLKETCENFENNVVDQKPQQTSPPVYSDSCNTTTTTVDPENLQTNAENEIDINENNIESNIIAGNKIPENSAENKPKRRRRRTPNKVAQKEEITIIKEEIIKTENKQDSNNPLERVECPDGTQLQTEMDELLNTDVADINFSNSSCGMESINNTFDETQVPQPQPSDVVNTPLYSPYINQNGDNYYPADMDIDKYEHRTIVNLDDGSVNVYSKMEDYNHFNTTQPPAQPSPPQPTPLPPPLLPPRSQTPIVETQSYMPPQTYSDNNPAFSAAIPEPEIFNNETFSSVISERELNEEDIQTILTELADGSLVLVSSLDPDDPDKVLNEIYMVDRNTGELCDEPLNIPDNIVQCILSVVS